MQYIIFLRARKKHELGNQNETLKPRIFSFQPKTKYQSKRLKRKQEDKNKKKVNFTSYFRRTQ